MSSHFAVEGSRAGDKIMVICSGELDIATTPAVENLVRDLLSEGDATSFELDWTGLTFMDSSGIRLLLGIVRRCQAAGLDLIWRFSEPAQRALDAVGIHDGVLRELGEQEAGRDY